MGKILYRHNQYIVIEEKNDGVILINTAGTYDSHGHLKKLSTAKMMINLMERKIIPRSNYLKETALRVSVDENYKNSILLKIKKDRNKQQYYNVNKGIKGR